MMGYLEEFQKQINSRDFSKFLQLWEEYCTNDVVEVEELLKLFSNIKSSDLAKPFGRIVETALPLWDLIDNEKDSYSIFKILIDLQTTNSPALFEKMMELLKKRYENHSSYNEFIRLVGIRNSDSFQGAMSSFDLLAHMAIGKFVYHSGGWGTGEIVDVSFLREQVTVEFENVAGRKQLLFSNSFKVLIPLSDDHFLVRRFADPDTFELEAKKDPVGAIKILLRDLGPQTAVEIKDELCELVIPEKDWVKWWQAARSKLKKDTMIEAPTALKDPFRLRSAEVAHEERFMQLLKGKSDLNSIILTSYSFVRDFPSVLKSGEIKSYLQEKFLSFLAEPEISKAQELQIQIFLENQLGYPFPEKHMQRLIEEFENIEDAVNAIDILAFKKRVLTLVRSYRNDWPAIFVNMLFSNQQSLLREYLSKELNSEDTRPLFIKKLKELLLKPQTNPEMAVWYFQVLLGKEGASMPFGDKEGICKWFESFLILFQYLEFKPEYRELNRKMYNLIVGKRYAVIRQIFEGTSIEVMNEFLLLVSKCQSLADTEQKTILSLAGVVHPSVLNGKNSKFADEIEDEILWTTEAGLLRTQELIQQIGTTEIVANAREIEAARSHGDLRENSEYKFALEKRARLQSDLKKLSGELRQSRIITPLDVSSDEVNIGSIVTLTDSKQNIISYTVLGPWDADPDKNILSINSKLVQAMLGCKMGERFKFRDEEFIITDLATIFDNQVKK